MESDSDQQNRQQRRKRDDKESRDFTCKCGKSYLSYAAAYTHVKNKHKGEQEYLTNITKPDRKMIKRGRPSRKIEPRATVETEKLCIVECAILEIYNLLTNVDANARIILEGNQDIRLDEQLKLYESIKGDLGVPGLELHIPSAQTDQNFNILAEFISSMTKHFCPDIVAKIMWFMNFCLPGPAPDSAHVDMSLRSARDRMYNELCLELWDQNREIPEILINALEKWIEVSLREKPPAASAPSE